MAKATEIPALGRITGVARKEPIYDTEGWAPGVPLASQIVTFTNFGAFNTAGLSVSKAFGRDTNLTGGTGGGLPQAHRFFWFKWRMKIRTLDANMATLANSVVFEQIARSRQLSSCTFQLAQTRYITVQSDELVGFTDSQYINTTHAGVSVMAPSVGDRQGRDVTTGKEPKILEPLENFNVLTNVPTIAAPLSPTVSLYVTEHLDGVLVRGGRKSLNKWDLN